MVSEGYVGLLQLVIGMVAFESLLIFNTAIVSTVIYSLGSYHNHWEIE